MNTEILFLIGYILLGFVVSGFAVKVIFDGMLPRQRTKGDAAFIGFMFFLLFLIWPILLLIFPCLFIGHFLLKIIK